VLDEAWSLSSSVALRPEPFGALAYHFGTRRLTFLKQPGLVDVVRGLEAAPVVRDALTTAGIDAAQWPAYVAALRRLADSDMIAPRPGGTA